MVKITTTRSDRLAYHACASKEVVAGGSRAGDVTCKEGFDPEHCSKFIPDKGPSFEVKLKRPGLNGYDDRQVASNKESLELESISPIEEALLVLLKEGPQTRDQLVKKTTLPRTTLYDGLRKLIIRNEVKKYPVYATDRSRGRPQVLFSIFDECKGK